ncbi:MAG: YicC family protein [Bacteroidetes bacterium]|nr:MAG: YicC family protein [Bacteroidota bacterium]
MIISMTGYGKAVAELPGKKLVIEIKSLNSKGLDLSVKLPGAFREKEMEIRTLLSQRLERGKVELYVSAERSVDTAGYSINKPLFLQYYQELKSLLSELKEENSDELLPVIMKIPDILQSEKAEFEETDWVLIAEGIESALQSVEEFRSAEGSILEADMRARVQLILDLLNSIEPFENNRLNDIRERIRTGFQNITKSDLLQTKPDENRFEHELIYYIERLDITEEKVRLKKHCDYFIQTLNDANSQGKKLGFVSQEMGREINTIGSKANDAGIQKIVVQMKDELEKIKEQLLNIL